MQRTFQQRWLLAATLTAGVLAAAAAPAWSQQTSASPGSGQAGQSGELNVPGKGPTDPSQLPGQRTEPAGGQQTGPLKEQAIQQGSPGMDATAASSPGAAGTSGTAGGATTSSGSPTSGAAAGTGVPHPAGGSEVPAGGAASPGAASSGAAPSASPK
jgi:hypothetical protein